MMSLWKALLGIMPEPEPAPMAVVEPDPLPAAPAAPTLPQKRDAAAHVARFARAIEECRIAIEHGESTVERLAEHERWHAYYTRLAALEAGEF